jgi:hypothetical protein
VRAAKSTEVATRFLRASLSYPLDSKCGADEVSTHDHEINSPTLKLFSSLTRSLARCLSLATIARDTVVNINDLIKEYRNPDLLALSLLEEPKSLHYLIIIFMQPATHIAETIADSKAALYDGRIHNGVCKQ